MKLQNDVIDEFSRFTLPMNDVIEFGQLILELQLSPEELAQLNPFYDYVTLSQDVFNSLNSLINEMIVFNYSPMDILYKNLPENLMQSLSDLLGEALSQSKQKFAETKEFKASADYEQLSKLLENSKDSLVAEISMLKDEIAKDGPRDDDAINERFKITVLDSIARTSGGMIEAILTFNRNNNKFLESIYEIVSSQKDLSTKIALAYIRV